MTRPRVFVQQPIPERALTALGEFADVDMFPHVDRRPSHEEMVTRAAEVDYLFALGETPITDAFLEAAKRLRLIATMEIFPTQIDLDAATARGIPVSGLPHAEEITDTTAEYTMALMLSVAWGIPRAERSLREGRWAQYQTVALPARRLRGKRLGIIGLGQIGQGVARRAGAHGMKLTYHDVERKPTDVERDLNIEWLPIESLLAESDIVTLCVTLTSETEALMDAARFAGMKDGAVFINTSRGRIVDEVALADALSEGRIAAAGLDVHRHEIPEPHPGPGDARLLMMDNVVLTPHIGTSAIETREWMATYVVENIAAHMRGDRPHPILNPEVYGEPRQTTDRIG